MTFMDSVIANSKKLWDDAVEVPFLTEMGQANLSSKKFINYIIQDSLYLWDYLKVFAIAIYKSKTKKEMQFFYSALSFVNDNENETRIKYLKDFGLIDDQVEKMPKYEECADYTNFMINIALSNEIPEILMAVMPCLLGYHYVFCKLKEKFPLIMTGYYAQLVKDYTSTSYNTSCEVWTEFCNKQCENLTEERKVKLNEIFLEASKKELYFWQMAGKEHD